jgi:nucleolar complex protein 3
LFGCRLFLKIEVYFDKLFKDFDLFFFSMATNFLENPEERMFLLDRLIRFMTLGQNENCVENTVIKLASASVLEILKDLIPNYKIADHESTDKTVKLKKDTLKLHRYETALLNCVKRFLVKCERIVSEASKHGKNLNLAPHSLRCMTELLVAHPDFNLAENIIQFSVPYLNR